MSELAVGIAGLGTIGRELAQRLTRDVPGVTVVAVSARDEARARASLAELEIDADVVNFEELARRSDIVIECAPARILRAIAEPTLRAGKELVTLSAGALLTAPDLIELAGGVWRADNRPFRRAARARRGRCRGRGPHRLGADDDTQAATRASSAHLLSKKPASTSRRSASRRRSSRGSAPRGGGGVPRKRQRSRRARTGGHRP